MSLLFKLLSRLRLITTIGAGTAGAVIVTAAVLLSLMVHELSYDVEARALENEERLIKAIATLFAKEYPTVKISWTSNDTMSDIVVDAMPDMTDHNVVENASRITGGPTTIFSFDPATNEFVRTSTTVKKPDGSRATGTTLDQKSPAYAL